jgi:hypothetical protein
MAGRHFTAIPVIIRACVLFTSVRLATVLYTVLVMRFKVISNIPSNWKRFCLCVDFCHPPEAAPGIERAVLYSPHDEFLRSITVRSLYNRFKTKNASASLGLKLRRTAAYLMIFLFLFMPSLVFRWSLKSTALVYLPFIKLSQKFSFARTSLKSRTASIIQEKGKLYYSLLVSLLLCTLVPVLTVTLFTDFAQRLKGALQAIPFAVDLTNYYFMFPNIELWNVVRLGCALLFMAVFFTAYFTHKALIHNQLSPTQPFAVAIDSFLRLVNLARAVGLYYLMCCGVLLFWDKVSHIHWVLPELGKALFPHTGK